MFRLLLIFLFILVIWPVIKVGYYLFKAQRTARRSRDAFRDAYSRTYGRNYGGDYSNGGGAPAQPRKKKVFSKTDGEYVEFEEIECELTEEYSSTSSDTYVREEQVSDAEWTEVK